MNYKTISLSTYNSNLVILKLDYEKKLNSLSQLFFDEFDDAIESILKNKDYKVLIIRGTEKVFSAGGDLKEIGSAGYEKALLMSMRVQKSFSALLNLKIPVIAALNGLVFGGGFELALHCDIRFCTNETILKLPESDLGLIPGAGGISIFSRIFSSADAAYYLFSGNQIPVADALSKGFVQKITNTDSIYDEAIKFAIELSKKSPESLTAIKKLLVMNLFEPLDACLEAEAREFSSVLQVSGKEKIKDFFNSKNKK